MSRQNSRSSNDWKDSRNQKSKSKYQDKRKKTKSKNTSREASSTTKFEDEYDPPFVLGHIWEPKEYYKIKLRHPFLQDQVDAFNFPIAEHETRMSDRAIFAQEIVRLMRTGNFDRNNGPLAYYTIERSTRGICRSDWDIVTQWRDSQADNASSAFVGPTRWNNLDMFEVMKINSSG